MILPNTDGGNITLKTILDAYASLPKLPDHCLLTGWPRESGYGLGLPEHLIRSQEDLNRIQYGLLDIISSEYVPRTKRVQFRFPRSKKKRVRKKWAKNPMNFCEVKVAWLMNRDAMKLRLPEPPSRFVREARA